MGLAAGLPTSLSPIFLVVLGMSVLTIARCHVLREGVTLVCGFVQVMLNFRRLLT